MWRADSGDEPYGAFGGGDARAGVRGEVDDVAASVLGDGAHSLSVVVKVHGRFDGMQGAFKPGTEFDESSGGLGDGTCLVRDEHGVSDQDGIDVGGQVRDVPSHLPEEFTVETPHVTTVFNDPIDLS